MSLTLLFFDLGGSEVAEAVPEYPHIGQPVHEVEYRPVWEAEYRPVHEVERRKVTESWST